MTNHEYHNLPGLTDGIQHMYRKFIGDMKDETVDKQEVTCPLCQRLFDETTVSKKFGVYFEGLLNDKKSSVISFFTPLEIILGLAIC